MKHGLAKILPAAGLGHLLLGPEPKQSWQLLLRGAPLQAVRPSLALLAGRGAALGLQKCRPDRILCMLCLARWAPCRCQGCALQTWQVQGCRGVASCGM